ncbi:molybdopterin cofactor-binding domain-containing protein [Pelomonas sp. SE-A7]|uniref:xanthine dehydrogenase family protein molybdopterin-binding subunit n=1 Tax=Pelomonas sp. SE-A7 TaxID=3054953 RepID=UPI00259CF62D|nr:molybdopterin cofactor-binding domain-containing protein [Pelomonas sp. SE-A7]MDM4766198.1 molybdopterin-dependent oxidoreductase [Pelomonas sp. SE-A7]
MSGGSSKLGTIARRTFLVGSVAIAGGVAFGTYLVRRTPANPLLDGRAEGETVFNPWVKIDAKGITLIAPHTDLGQGARSVQAALIAEELDLGWGQFTVDPGPPAAAYYNTALAGEQVPFMSTDTSATAEALRSTMGALFKVLGLQLTGGSSTVPDSFDKLRRAGAVARETLKRAAAKQSGVPLDQLKTEQGAVVLPDGRRIAYTALAREAAAIEPVQEVVLRDPSQWRLIGKPMQRLDVVAKSTGTQTYGIDLRMEGLLHATVKVNPRQGGALLGYDAKVAAAMRGVKKIVPVTNGVAVIADNTWRAFQAANALNIQWGPAPYPAEQAEHWRAVAESFVPERLDKQWRNDGNIETALDDKSLSAEYKAPYLAHAPLEPLSAVVKVTAERVDVWVSSQVPRFAQEKVAKICGVAVERVHLHNQVCGGSFGHRLEFENITLAAEVAKQMPGVPIKLTFSREEDFAHDFPRQITMSRARGSVKDGKVEALSLDIASVSSSSSQMKRLGQPMPGPDGQIPAGAWNLPYALPHFRLRAYRVPELAPTSSWRSVGASSAGFFADGFLDELIHAAGADPLLERLRLASDPVARKVLEAVGEMSGWKGARLGEGRGRGVAFVESFGVPCAQVVEVHNTPQGLRIAKVWVALDVGKVVDPVNFDNQVKGAVVWGLGHAMNCEITYADGQAQQTNFHAYPGMRLNQCPEIVVRGLEHGAKLRGAGEPPVPPAAPALANAIFAATGQRLREMPFSKQLSFA